ncbi:uncharacterized protein LOC141509423 isoform X3 [Macrotis lagotis]|uniref:uncharacterized protein LOC141509423 isoform X3 n=1 Tax=Macrotis lagotis TaxID=92651 RepID=UPI003D69BF09
MWLFWAFLVFIHPLGGPPLQSPSCPWEPFEGLVAIMEALGDTNDGTLYTPDNLSKLRFLGFPITTSISEMSTGPRVGENRGGLREGREADRECFCSQDSCSTPFSTP